jgi:putative endonuclease
MFYVYVIRSVVDPSYHYKGFCSDIEERLKEHNAGQTKSIKHKIPFELVYVEQYNNLDSAIKREKYFKTGAGRRFLKVKLKLK